MRSKFGSPKYIFSIMDLPKLDLPHLVSSLKHFCLNKVLSVPLVERGRRCKENYLLENQFKVDVRTILGSTDLVKEASFNPMSLDFIYLIQPNLMDFTTDNALPHMST